MLCFSSWSLNPGSLLSGFHITKSWAMIGLSCELNSICSPLVLFWRTTLKPPRGSGPWPCWEQLQHAHLYQGPWRHCYCGCISDQSRKEEDGGSYYPWKENCYRSDRATASHDNDVGFIKRLLSSPWFSSLHQSGRFCVLHSFNT